MKNTTICTTAQTRGSKVRSDTHVQAGTGASTTANIAIGTLGALIGTWSMACFIGGLLAAGGPLSLAKSWFTAITGI